QAQQHASASHYHSQQQQQPHHPPSSHASVAQYHAHQSHAHVASLPAPVHHVATVVDVGNPYQNSSFASYAHSAYHAQQAVGPHAGTFDSAGGTSVDSAMATSTAAQHAPTSPTLAQQQALQATSDSNLHFECILEAPTAAAQRADESPLTYLNKGQLYGVSFLDRSQADTFYSTTLRIAFHEDSHRKGAATYWNFWLNQQESPRAARAIELDKAGSIGVVAAESKQFDRVTFQWQGRRGAKVMIRFNCLSTDFSRIKGVKGIPLRIHLDTHYALPNPAAGASGVSDFAATMNQLSSPLPPFTTAGALTSTQVAPATMRSGEAAATSGVHSNPVLPALVTQVSSPNDIQQPQGATASLSVSITAAAAAAHAASHVHAMSSAHGSGLIADKIIERSFARIKLFRDKGAERKNKDDQRHLEKLWEKKKAGLALKSPGTSTPQQQMAEFAMAFAPVLPTTPFFEYTLTGDDCDNEEPVTIEDMWSVGGRAATTGLDPDVSAISPSMSGLSSMNIGMSGIHLGNLGSPLSPSSTSMFMRKRLSEDDVEPLMSPSSKRQFSPSSQTSSMVGGMGNSSATRMTFGPNNVELVGVDPTYVPAVRKRKSVLAIYARFQGESIHRAIYLERLGVDDLVEKLAQRLEMPTGPGVEVVRRTKKGVTVKVDDSVVMQLDDEQDMEVEWAFSDESGALTLCLHY
ncbi:hypothetical protein GGF42_007935, partial [Coemansia sp. RSA 2424]